MDRFKTIVALGFPIVVIAFGLGVYTGYRMFKPTPTKAAANATLILTALHDRGFLVTQTYVFDQPVTIDRSSGNAFKDFFFGEKITARGTMEVNLGIDLGKVAGDDVSVQDDKIVVRVPKASLFNSRLVGPLEVQNDRGVLKRLLEADQGYNDALSELSKQAEAAAAREELVSRADDRAKEDVTRLLEYVAPGKTVEVVSMGE